MGGDTRGRAIVRWLLGALYLVAGVAHLRSPGPFLAITPGWVPKPALVIAVTGVCELIGAAALVQPWSGALRRAAGWALAAYAVCVFPANINHMLIDMAKPDHGLGWAYHAPRMVVQPLLVWAAIWCSRPGRQAATEPDGS